VEDFGEISVWGRLVTIFWNLSVPDFVSCGSGYLNLVHSGSMCLYLIDIGSECLSLVYISGVWIRHISDPICISSECFKSVHFGFDMCQL
jgi:hypothetical protein